jgi:hypothetical protein
MYHINIRGLKSKPILDKIYQDMKDYNLQNIITLTYVPLDDSFWIVEKYENVKIFLLTNEFLEKIEKTVLEEWAYQWILHDSHIIVYENVTEENKKRLIDLNMHLHYVSLRNILSIDNKTVQNLTIADNYLIMDMLDFSHNTRKYEMKHFGIKLSIEADGIAYQDGNVLGNLEDELFIDVLHKSEIKHSEESKVNLFGYHLYEPFYFLKEKDICVSEIIAYKEKLFDILKELNPEDYIYLCNFLVNNLNKNYYIKYDELNEIISGKDKYLKFY